MRSIFARIILLSASTLVVPAAGAEKPVQIQPGYGYYMQDQAPVGHRQPTQDYTKIEKDNAQLDVAPTQEVTGAYQVQSAENALARLIEQENDRLDRQLRGICRGC